MSPSRIGHLTREWWESTLRILLFAGLLSTVGLVVLVVSFVVLAVKLVLSVLGSFFERRNRGITINTGQGFFKGLASQLMSFFFIGKLFGPKATVPVCDYRVRDSGGNEHHVRMEGHVVSGSLAVGDSVMVHGYDHDGTLIARGGWNHRVSSQLTVRRR